MAIPFFYLCVCVCSLSLSNSVIYLYILDRWPSLEPDSERQSQKMIECVSVCR